MKHRHIEIAPGTALAQWPSAALVDLLDRGDLGDWRPILVEVAKDPFGELAERVQRLIDAYPMDGTSALWRAWIHHRRDMTEGRREAVAPVKPVPLAGIRKRLGLTQVEVAARMGISQSDLSKLERRGDLRVSTLESYAKALGVELRVLVGSKLLTDVPVRFIGRDRASSPDSD